MMYSHFRGANALNMLAGIAGHLLAVFFIVQILGAKDAWALGATLAAAGLCLGIIHGWLLGRRHVRRAGISALIARCIFWLPSIPLTYGFSLLGLPLVGAYALVAGIGASFGARQAR